MTSMSSATTADAHLERGDVWGGLTAMLVALPSALAYGIVALSPLGPDGAAHGAIAGMVGVVVLGLVAPALGGAPRLITAPCAPAAAVLGAFAATLAKASVPLPKAILLLSLATAVAGLLQLGIAALRGGKLIKYIPYPVVTGYLSGVAVLIFLGQVPRLFGWPKGTAWGEGLLRPELWQGPGLVVGLVTLCVMVGAPRLTKAVPGAILGLGAGVGAFGLLAIPFPTLRSLEGNPLVLGPIRATFDLGALWSRWTALPELSRADLTLVAVPAATLAVLLSIDTLKTCVVLDALTRSRHASNRELVAQGAGNFVSSLLGGMAGAGTSGATLVNLAAGGRTRLSGVLAGGFALLAVLLLGPLVAWTPIPALAGILLVVAARMFDTQSFQLLRQRSTVLDFLVIVAVIVTAVTVGLIAASAIGVILAALLFLREQIRTSPIRRRIYGDQWFSKQKRLPDEMAVLETSGRSTVVAELHGSLFFGTTDQLMTELEEDISRCDFVILDLRRVVSVDLTAVHLMEQIEARLRERGGELLFTGVRRVLPTGQDLHAYLEQAGLIGDAGHVRLFAEVSDALEWTEGRRLQAAAMESRPSAAPLALEGFDLWKGLPPEAQTALECCLRERSLEAGQPVFERGDPGDELFLIRKGRVRIELPVPGRPPHHLATFARGDFFGDMAFLDGGARSADAFALSETELYVLSRKALDSVVADEPELGWRFFAGVSRALARRLRRADAEIGSLEGA